MGSDSGGPFTGQSALHCGRGPENVQFTCCAMHSKPSLPGAGVEIALDSAAELKKDAQYLVLLEKRLDIQHTRQR